jgi:hypothetical protein
MLYNENVTRKNVIDHLYQVLQKCKPGDAFVFFYSGHGAWMSNPMNKFDSVKKGMSQSMVMSDLYSPNLDCLLTDEVLKTVFNEFVDKKVIVTSLFDCCYSGNLSMGYMTDYWVPFLRPTTKGLLISGVNYIPEKIKPQGCYYDNSGRLLDTTDTDHDGVPDCRDWEIDSPPFVPVDSLGVTSGNFSAEDFIDSSEKFKSTHPDAAANEERSFNMKDALKVWYPLRAKRPSDRSNSNFISMSAASDVEPGAEITDESEMRHGAFTKALLSVYQENVADLPLSELFKKISQRMKEQGYFQTPTFHYDPSRLKGNLIGTNSAGFLNAITATCISAAAGYITIDKGLNADVARGNIFKDLSIGGNKKITVTKIYNDSAVAIDRSGLIKPGHKFELIDHFTVSNPIIKIFIPTINCSATDYAAFLNSRIKPFVDSSNYSDFRFNNDAKINTVTLFYDAKDVNEFSNSSLNGWKDGVDRIVFLPLPSFFINGLKNFLAKDQNFELVNKPADADYVLYLNYMKARPGYAAGYVFYFHPRIDDPANNNMAIFSSDHLQTPRLNLSLQELQSFSKELYGLTKKTIRYKTTKWINPYPRR